MDTGKAGNTREAERRYQRRLMGSKNQRVAVKRGMKKTETPFKPVKIRS